MSIESAFESEGIEFPYMNKPVEPDGNSYKKKDFKSGKIYVHCPYCGAKQFPVSESTRIQYLPWKCKSSKCKMEFEVNV